jgi:replicative DNA helicase
VDAKEISDVQSEAGIIASLIVNPDFILYSEDLKPNHFYDITNGCLYWAINELYKVGITNIDSYNLFNIINTNKSVKRQIESQFNTEGLNEVISLASTLARGTMEEYKKLSKNVISLAFRRQILKDLQSCETLCFKDEFTTKELHKNIAETLDRTSLDFLSLDEILQYSDIVEELWQQTLSRQGNSGICGYPSKFPTLNKYCTYEQGELIMVCGHRKEGKSMVCLNELVDKLQRDVGCLYIDTEMSTRLFNERLLCHLAKIPMKDLKNGNYDENGKKRIREAIDWLKTRNFVHVYTPSWTKDQLYILAKKLKRQNNMSFFIMDYIKSKGGTDSSAVYNELGDTVNFIKNEILGELNLSGLAAAQLNRGGEIGDSYKIEQYASTVLLLLRKKPDQIINDGPECGNYKLHVKLNRLGDQMSDIDRDYIDLNFEGNIASFEEAKQHDPDLTPFR